MRIDLTDAKVRSIKPGKTRLEIKDGRYPLMLIVQPSGVKSFQFRGTVAGKQVRKVLGQYDAMSLGEARTAALAMQNEAKQGKVPAPIQERLEKADKGILTSVAFGIYMEREGDKKKSAGEKWRIWEREIEPTIGALPLKEVTRHQLAKIVTDKSETSLSMANAIQSLLSRFFNWCMVEGWGHTFLDANPCQYVKKPGKLQPKDVFLDHHHIKWLFKALPVMGEFAAPVEFTLRTGLRRGDVFGMEWPMVRGDVLDLPTTKNGLPFLVNLAAHDSIKALLPERKLTGPVWSVSPWLAKAFDRLNDKMAEIAAKEGRNEPLERFTLHCFRRTFRTLIARERDERGPLVSKDIREKVLNHVDASVGTKHYDRHDYFVEKSDALRVWNSVLDRLRDEGHQPTQLAA